MSKNTTVASIILILLLVFSYFLFQKGTFQNFLKEKNTVSNQGTNSPTDSTSASQSPAVDPKSQIIKSVNTKKYSQLEEFMVMPQITFTIMSSDCCGKITPKEAVDQLKYIDNGIPFDFDQNLPTITNLKAKNPQLKDSYIGISENGEYLVALKLNSQNLIEEIQVSVSYKLYNQ